MKRIRFIVVFLVLFSLTGCSYIKEKKEQWFGDDDDVVEVAPATVETDEIEVVPEEEGSEAEPPTEDDSDIHE